MTPAAASRSGFSVGHRCAPRLRGPISGARNIRCCVRNIDYPQALLFDCDGVLVDTEKDGHRLAFNQTFQQLGLSAEWDVPTYGELLRIGGGKERMNFYFSEREHEEPFKSRPSPESRTAFLKQAHAIKTGIFQKMIEEGSLPLRPGVSKLVGDTIARGITVAVCSTSNEKAVQTIVDVLLGADVSSVMRVFAGDIVSKKKPDPEIYTLAASELGVEPARCVVVEDSHIGLRAARAAGMRCVVTSSVYTQDEDFSLADAVFDCIGEDGDERFGIEDLSTPGSFWLNPPLPMDTAGNWINPPSSPYGDSWTGIDVDLER